MSIKSFTKGVSRTFDDLGTTTSSFISRLGHAVGSYIPTISRELISGNMAGINYAEAEQINKALEDYVEKLVSDIDEVNAKADSTIGIKGQKLNTAVEEFAKNVKEAAHNSISQIRQFQDILNRAIDNYKLRDQEISSGLDDAGTGLASEVERLERFEHKA